jgi:hypothetical protein
LLHHNPYSNGGFKLQIICLTIAPAFIAAGLYLNLKHMVIVFGPHLSLLKPALYIYIFIGCDVLSIAFQAAGAGLAAAGVLITDASHFIVTGLCFQVFTLLKFGIISGKFFLKASRHREEPRPDTVELEEEPEVQMVPPLAGARIHYHYGSLRLSGCRVRWWLAQFSTAESD